MRVALIVEWLDSRRGGAETSTGQFIAHLCELGAEIEVFTRSEDCEIPGVTVRTLSVADLFKPLGTPLFCQKADRAVANGRFSVIHSLVPSMVADIYQPRGGSYAETMRRNVALRRGALSRWTKALAQKASIKQQMMLMLESKCIHREGGPAILALSDYVRRQFREHYQVEDSRIRVVFNGVDPDDSDEQTRRDHRSDVRRRHAIAENEYVVLMVAHNLRLKGLGPWIDALALLERDGGCQVRAVVAGKGDVRPWRRLAEQRGVPISFVGPVAAIRDYYHACDVLVHPTYYDPCSRVVLESIASGLPCITTRFDGAAEAVRDGDSGYVLNSPEEVEELAARVRTLSDADIRGQMVQTLKNREFSHTMRKHADVVFDVYRTLCAR